ncbi:metallophosphoesterase family protein [Aliiroseovarius sp. 2305UL8-7]|uniref:metallophosphoesterase family protein n=1 Tax=Aliiroseovarius conchicola TaxID=3121637 RepID=UPI0035291C97
MRWIKGLFGGSKDSSAEPKFGAPIVPDAPFFAVADIHGRLDLLEGVLRQLEQVDEPHPTVFVGDYVDRGPDSAGVLRRLFDLQSAKPDQVVCLAGNHEDMLLGFLDDPVRYHRLWLRNGGAETLRSFNVMSPEDERESEILDARDELSAQLGADLRAWLSSLPVSWRSGNVWVTHAGADPAVDMERQDRHALIWGHPEFHKRAREDGQWVVHGHTIVPEVSTQEGRISIDTGAYLTGDLSFVRISDTGAAVIS